VWFPESDADVYSARDSGPTRRDLPAATWLLEMPRRRFRTRIGERRSESRPHAHRCIEMFSSESSHSATPATAWHGANTRRTSIATVNPADLFSRMQISESTRIVAARPSSRTENARIDASFRSRHARCRAQARRPKSTVQSRSSPFLLSLVCHEVSLCRGCAMQVVRGHLAARQCSQRQTVNAETVQTATDLLPSD
jgi:hypothetical protein